MASPSHNTLAVFGLAIGLYVSGRMQMLQAFRRRAEIISSGSNSNVPQHIADATDNVAIYTLLGVLSVAFLKFKDQPTKLATLFAFTAVGFGIGKMYIPEHMILSLVNQGTRIE